MNFSPQKVNETLGETQIVVNPKETVPFNGRRRFTLRTLRIFSPRPLRLKLLTAESAKGMQRTQSARMAMHNSACGLCESFSLRPSYVTD